MSLTFTKLFSSITESTVWCEPAHTRLVWITMLAMADRKGRVWASVPGLANRARVPLEDAEKAILTFLAPDRYSRTPDHDGRRIEPIDGGWRLLNYAKYREIRDAEDRRDYQRKWDRENRTKSDKSDKIRPGTTKAEAEAEASKSRAAHGTRLPPDWKPTPDLQAWAEKKRPDLNLGDVLERFRDYWAAQPGQKGVKLDWQATYRNWVRGEKRINGAAAPSASRPSIKCRSCGQTTTIWTSGRCDPCWRKEQGMQ